MKLKIKNPEGKIIEKTVEEGVSCAQLIKHLSFAFPLLACKVNHHYERLNTPITQDAEIELLSEYFDSFILEGDSRCDGGRYNSTFCQFNFKRYFYNDIS